MSLRRPRLRSAAQPHAAMFLAAMLVLYSNAPTSADTLSCTLTRTAETYSGSCSIPCRVNALAVNIDGPRKGFSCNDSDRQVQASLARSGKGDDWLGKMEGKHPEDPTRFGLIEPRDGKPGVAKTPFGWFRLEEAKTSGQVMSLKIAADKQLPPTADDVRILRRAMELVSKVELWNRADTRICLPKPDKWSVFCALMQATEEVSGGVHYRQPALQAAREAINEVGGSRVQKHRLMDYNNHPDTTLEDIQNLLTLSLKKLETRFR